MKSMSALIDQKIVMCNKDTPPLPRAELKVLLQKLPAWELIDAKGIAQLNRSYEFGNFSAALLFTQQVGALAQTANHHPTLLTQWGKVTVCWWTHTCKGLHINDFIMAARCDVIFAGETSFGQTQE